MVAGASGISFLRIKNRFLNLFLSRKAELHEIHFKIFLSFKEDEKCKSKVSEKRPHFFVLAQNPIKGL